MTPFLTLSRDYIDAVIAARKCALTQNPATLMDNDDSTDTHLHPAARAASDKLPIPTQPTANHAKG